MGATGPLDVVVVVVDGSLVHRLQHLLVEVLHQGDSRLWDFFWTEVDWAVVVVGCLHIVKVDPRRIVLVFHSETESKPRDADFHSDAVTFLELLPEGVGDPLKVSLGAHQVRRDLVVQSDCLVAQVSPSKPCEQMFLLPVCKRNTEYLSVSDFSSWW